MLQARHRHLGGRRGHPGCQRAQGEGLAAGGCWGRRECGRIGLWNTLPQGPQGRKLFYTHLPLSLLPSFSPSWNLIFYFLTREGINNRSPPRLLEKREKEKEKGKLESI